MITLITAIITGVIGYKIGGVVTKYRLGNREVEGTVRIKRR